MKRYLRAPVLALTVFIVSCGATDLIKSFRVALAASPALVASLVSSGAINQPTADAITKDFSDGVKCADTLQTDFKAIPKDDPNAKSLKLNAAVKGMRCFRVIIQRRNFEKNPRVKNAADIADGILASLVVFYSENGVMVASTRASVTAVDEKELEKKLKAEVKKLEAALRP